MPRYRYTVMDASGNRTTGELDAESAAAVASELQAKGLSVESIQLQAASSESPRHLTDQQVTDLAHQIAGITHGGLPLAGGLRALAEETGSGALRNVLWTLADQLEAGVSLEDAMRGQGDRLPAHMRALVLAGVRTGKLGQVLEQHVKYFNMVAELKRKLWVSLAYPALLLSILSGLMTLVSFLVVGGFKRIFMDFGIKLPVITLAVINIADVVMKAWWLVPLLLIAAVFVWWILLGGIWGAAARRRLTYRIPFVGPVLRWSSLARFCHLLGLLLESELPLPAALQLAGEGSRDPEIADACRSVTLSTEAGQSLSGALAGRRFPAELAHIIGWGEGIQTLPEAMYMAGEMFEGRAKLHTTFVTTAVSPVAFVLLIFGVGITVVALFAPLFKLMTELSG